MARSGAAENNYEVHSIEVEGVKYIKFAFYLKILGMTDSLIEDLVEENRKLKHTNNKLRQKLERCNE